MYIHTCTMYLPCGHINSQVKYCIIKHGYCKQASHIESFFGVYSILLTETVGYGCQCVFLIQAIQVIHAKQDHRQNVEAYIVRGLEHTE